MIQTLVPTQNVYNVYHTGHENIEPQNTAHQSRQLVVWDV